MSEAEKTEQQRAEEEARRKDERLAAEKLAAEADRRTREAARMGGPAASNPAHTQQAAPSGGQPPSVQAAAAAASVAGASGGDTGAGGIKPTPQPPAKTGAGGGGAQPQPTGADKEAERQARVAREARDDARRVRAVEKTEVETLIAKHRNSRNRARIAWAIAYYLLSFLSVIFAVATVVVLDLDSINDAATKKDWATGFATFAAVTVILSLWLRHGQNLRRHAATLPRLDSLRVDLTRPEANFDEIRNKLTAIITDSDGPTP